MEDAFADVYANSEAGAQTDLPDEFLFGPSAGQEVKAEAKETAEEEDIYDLYGTEKGPGGDAQIQLDLEDEENEDNLEIEFDDVEAESRTGRSDRRFSTGPAPAYQRSTAGNSSTRL